MFQVEKEKEKKPDPEFIIDESSVLNPDEVSYLQMVDNKHSTLLVLGQIHYVSVLTSLLVKSFIVFFLNWNFVMTEVASNREFVLLK